MAIMTAYTIDPKAVEDAMALIERYWEINSIRQNDDSPSKWAVDGYSNKNEWKVSYRRAHTTLAAKNIRLISEDVMEELTDHKLIEETECHLLEAGGGNFIEKATAAGGVFNLNHGDFAKMMKIQISATDWDHAKRRVLSLLEPQPK